MPVLRGLEAAELLIDLIERPVSSDERLALAECVLRFGGHDGLNLNVERHGVMTSLAVFCGKDWVYSFVPAQSWLLAYVRPPEVRKRLLTLERLQQAFPDASSPQPDHYTVRLKSHADAETFCSLVLSNR
jgi:hypothetical protein